MFPFLSSNCETPHLDRPVWNRSLAVATTTSKYLGSARLYSDQHRRRELSTLCPSPAFRYLPPPRLAHPLSIPYALCPCRQVPPPAAPSSKSTPAAGMVTPKSCFSGSKKQGRPQNQLQQLLLAISYSAHGPPNPPKRLPIMCEQLSV